MVNKQKLQGTSLMEHRLWGLKNSCPHVYPRGCHFHPIRQTDNCKICFHVPSSHQACLPPLFHRTCAVGWTIVEKRVFSRSAPYYAVGAVGLSSLAFAVQVRGKGSHTAFV